MTHLIQTANGQLMLQTINSPTPATGQLQVAGSQHPHLQQIQVLPISNLQAPGNQIVLQSSGAAAAAAAPQQAAQIIQTSDGQTLLYPIQIDSQGNITQHQPQPGSIIQLASAQPQHQQQAIQSPPTASSPPHLTASPAPNSSQATPTHHAANTVGGVVAHHQQQPQHAALPANVVMVNNTNGNAVATASVPQIQRVPITGAAQVLEEEPLYVNAKQYHRIVKRREARAKLENDGRIPKERRKYLHESRHRHAMNRVRGEGGRFDKGNSPEKVLQNNHSRSGRVLNSKTNRLVTTATYSMMIMDEESVVNQRPIAPLNKSNIPPIPEEMIKIEATSVTEATKLPVCATASFSGTQLTENAVTLPWLSSHINSVSPISDVINSTTSLDYSESLGYPYAGMPSEDPALMPEQNISDLLPPHSILEQGPYSLQHNSSQNLHTIHQGIPFIIDEEDD